MLGWDKSGSVTFRLKKGAFEGLIVRKEDLRCSLSSQLLGKCAGLLQTRTILSDWL